MFLYFPNFYGSMGKLRIRVVWHLKKINYNFELYFIWLICLQEIQEAILTKSADVELVNNLGENYKGLIDPDHADIIADKLEDLNKKWDWLLGTYFCMIVNSMFFIFQF